MHGILSYNSLVYTGFTLCKAFIYKSLVCVICMYHAHVQLMKVRQLVTKTHNNIINKCACIYHPFRSRILNRSKSIVDVCAHIQGNDFISCWEWVWNGAVKLSMCCVWVLMEEKQTSSWNDTLSLRTGKKPNH